MKNNHKIRGCLCEVDRNTIDDNVIWHLARRKLEYSEKTKAHQIGILQG